MLFQLGSDMKFMASYKQDVFAGLTVGVMAVPLGLAFGVQSGLGAVTGLYGAMILSLFSAVLGGTSTMISGPTGPMTIMSAFIIGSIFHTVDDRGVALNLIMLTFVFAGLFQILLGFMRIGASVKYVSYPVLSGFMSGVGVIIALLQISPLFGVPSPKSTIDILTSLPSLPAHSDWQSLGLGCGTIGIIYLFPRVTKSIPSILVALLSMTVLTRILNIHVPTIGSIPEGLPDFKVDFLWGVGWKELKYVFYPAITLGALGAIDSLLTSVVADNLTKTRHDSNRELMAQGLGNICVALAGGLLGAGATSRTMMNVRLGARTRIAGFTHSMVILLVLLGVGYYVAKIPLGVLAGILFTVGIGIIDYRSFKHIRRIPKADAAVMLTVLFMTVFVDLLEAVAVGMVLGSVLFIKRVSDISEEQSHVKSLRKYEREKPWDDEVSIPDYLKKRVFIKHLYGPIFFGFASQLSDMFNTMPKMAAVVIRMEHVPYIDQTGLYAIENAVLDLFSKGVEVAFSGIQSQPEDMLRAIDLIPELVPEKDIFKEFDDCLRWLEEKFEV